MTCTESMLIFNVNFSNEVFVSLLCLQQHVSGGIGPVEGGHYFL